jgi:peptidoglycan/LPS O-acetylase OafA/YrhL
VSVIFNRDNLIGPILNLKLIIYIGSISYGIYIFHMTIFNAVKILLLPKMTGNSLEVISATFEFTIIIASASYYLYEKPIMSLKHRLNR